MRIEPMLTTEQINDLHRLYWSEHWPIRKIERRTEVNKARRSRVRTYVRKFEEALVAGDAKAAKTDVYGYMLATVNPEGEPPGTIHFQFVEFNEDSIPSDVVQRFTKPFVHECFVGNRKMTQVELNH